MITNTYLNCIHLVRLLISRMYMYQISEINFSYCEKTWEDLKLIGTQIKKPGHCMQQQFLFRLTLRRTRKLTSPQWFNWGGGGDLTPPRSFWYVAVLQNDFTFSGKPLIFLTRWGIFYGWWHCWRPVTSPTMVAHFGRHPGFYQELEMRLKPREMVIFCALHEK